MKTESPPFYRPELWDIPLTYGDLLDILYIAQGGSVAEDVALLKHTARVVEKLGLDRAFPKKNAWVTPSIVPTVDLGVIWKQYADSLGLKELTDEQKQQALLNFLMDNPNED